MTTINTMETINKTAQTIATILLKDFSIHTATSLSRELRLSRQGIWKILRKLEKDGLIMFEQIGKGQTSVQRIRLNWDNELVEKSMALFLAQEALQHQRWRFNFAELKPEVDFLILYGSILHSPKEARDIDIIGVVSKEKDLAGLSDKILKAQETQDKKIHSINLTQKELKQELKRPNKAYAEAIKKGVILFGQEEFIKFIRGLQKWQ
ncbi:MAG: winged helix-turn-helix transcriptional regulator [Nanoarchaeota archaeon]|nr:winged helix-turn-helix transcriptional regulator [Nanoarchaeota archaeon]